MVGRDVWLLMIPPSSYYFHCFTKYAPNFFQAFKAVTEEEITHAVEKLRSSSGRSMLEIKTRIGSRKNLGRPKTTPVENKEDFMHFLALKP